MNGDSNFEDQFKSKDISIQKIKMSQLPFTRSIMFTKADLDRLRGNSLYFVCTARLALESLM